MADNADDVQSEITLDDFNADEQPSVKAEPSPAAEEAKAEAKAEPEPEKAPEEKPEEKTEGEKEETQADDTAVPSPEDKEPSKAEERKTQLNTEIRDLVARRNALKTEVEKANAEAYQPAAEKELLDETNPDTGEKYTGVEAKVEALRQSNEMERYNARVTDAQLTLSSESERVLNDFPIFREGSDTFDEELAKEAAELLRANLIIDDNTNQVIGSNVSPYQLYKTIARAADASATKGQVKGQQAAEKMMANADPSTGAAPAVKAKTAQDELLAMWKSDD